MRERFIIHVNVADFAVAVERLIDARLRGYPVIIAPFAAVRAVVYDMSEEAYQNGIRKGMALKKAVRQSRDAIVVAPHYDRYESAMGELLKCALPYSPLIELADNNGHLFVDATGTGKLFGPPPDVAWRIRKEVRSRMGIDPIWAIAPNKLTAKVATRLVKPTGEYILGAGDEEKFLSPVRLYLIPGIEQTDLKIFNELNLKTAGHVAAWSKDQLEVIFGKRSPDIYNSVRGIDSSPVAPVGRQYNPVTADHEFENDVNDPEIIEGALYMLAEKAGAELRKRMLAAKRLGIMLNYSDGKCIARNSEVNPASANDIFLFKTARLALTKAWTRRVRIRHLRLVCDHLTRAWSQRGLFFDRDEEKTQNLVSTVDKIRRRFGRTAIRIGRTIQVSPL